MSNVVADLKRLAEHRGLTVTEVSSGHFKVSGKGDVVVNYWPNSKNRTAHVEGAKRGVSLCDPLDVIQMAVTEPRKADLQPMYKEKRVERIEAKMEQESKAALDSENKSPPWDE